VKLGISSLPEKVNWTGLLAVSCLAGIGFTMSIFISNLSLANSDITYAKIGIILASVISGVLGVIALFFKLKSFSKNEMLL